MSCQKCQSPRVASISGKTSDMCGVSIGEREQDGYVPRDMNVGGGDHLRFSMCLNCGQHQGKFPVPPTALERGEEE